jgi:serine acetyltransferase
LNASELRRTILRPQLRRQTNVSSIAYADIAVCRQRLFRLNRIVCWLATSSNPIPRNLARILFHVELPEGAPPIRLPHPYMVVINKNTVIGSNCTFYHNVTIASRQFGMIAGAPVIGDEVIIYPGACIIGRITIGERAIIGAGSIVVNDVPPNTVVAGNPANVVGHTY